MKMKDYIKTWEGMQVEKYWTRLMVAGLMVMLVVLSIAVFSKRQTVVIQPFTLSEEAWIATDNVSRSYKEAWGMAFAILIGNSTPASVDFIKDRLAVFLSPRIYTQVIDVIEIQAREIQRDRITTRFEPRSIEFEGASNKVFVYGFSYVRGATGREDRNEKTYEFVISVSGYAPQLESIDTYSGKPRTQKILGSMKASEKGKN